MKNLFITILIVGVVIFTLRRGLPGFFCFRGYAHQDRAEYESAEQWFLKALYFEKIVQKITGKQRGIAIMLTNLGLLYHCQGKIDEAANMFKKAIGIYSGIGRINDLAPIYGSLGKLYFDEGNLSSAEEALNEALAIYSRRRDAQVAIQTTATLLDLISERKQNSDTPSTYKDTTHGFSFVIPAGWLRQRSVRQFANTGGQIAISHKKHRATLNVSVGPLDRPEWKRKNARVSAVRNYLKKVPERIGVVEVHTSDSFAGESNTISAEYETEVDVDGVSRRRRNGFISIIHNGLEYAMQWSAESDYEEHIKGIIGSFKFEN